jgi:hypothetical protein
LKEESGTEKKEKKCQKEFLMEVQRRSENFNIL